jgi:hypothetical protein
VRLPRPPRPSPRRLGATLAVIALLVGLAFLVLPVDAALGDDPLLHLVPFSPALGQAISQVDCGAPVSNFGRHSDDLSLASLARDGVCRHAAARRAASAVAATAVIGLLGLITMAGARDREVVAA